MEPLLPLRAIDDVQVVKEKAAEPAEKAAEPVAKTAEPAEKGSKPAPPPMAPIQGGFRTEKPGL